MLPPHVWEVVSAGDVGALRHVKVVVREFLSKDGMCYIDVQFVDVVLGVGVRYNQGGNLLGEESTPENSMDGFWCQVIRGIYRLLLHHMCIYCIPGIHTLLYIAPDA